MHKIKTTPTTNNQEIGVAPNTIFTWHLIRNGAHFGIAHVPNQKLRTRLVHPKDKITAKERTNVVYKINCKDCPQYYVGKTGRKLDTRLKEHQAAIRRHVETLFRHNFDNTTIITTAPRKKSRLLKEALFFG